MAIHYISPFRQDKNIGKSINEAVINLTADLDDWIIHLDHDVLFLLPDTKAQIERILLSTEFDVLSCMTNRIRSKEQLINGHFSDDDRVREHIHIAEICRTLSGDEVVPAKGVMAAFMLCFRISAWQKVGGFVEGPINFDTVFNVTCRDAGLKIGLMKGVYVFHSYRLLSKVPFQDCLHLLKK